MAKRSRLISSLRPSALIARGFQKVFERADNRWLLAGAFAVYLLRSLTKGRASRWFTSPHGKTRLKLDQGVSYLVTASPRKRT